MFVRFWRVSCFGISFFCFVPFPELLTERIEDFLSDIDENIDDDNNNGKDNGKEDYHDEAYDSLPPLLGLQSLQSLHWLWSLGIGQYRKFEVKAKQMSCFIIYIFFTYFLFLNTGPIY